MAGECQAYDFDDNGPAVLPGFEECDMDYLDEEALRQWEEDEALLRQLAEKEKQEMAAQQCRTPDSSSSATATPSRNSPAASSNSETSPGGVFSSTPAPSPTSPPQRSEANIVGRRMTRKMKPTPEREAYEAAKRRKLNDVDGSSDNQSQNCSGNGAGDTNSDQGIKRREAFQVLFWNARSKWIAAWVKNQPENFWRKKESYDEKRKAARKAWGKLSKPAREEYLKEVFSTSSQEKEDVPPHLAAALKAAEELRSVCFILTWTVSEQHVRSFRNILELFQQIRAANDIQDNVKLSSLCSDLAKTEIAKKDWQSFQEFVLPKIKACKAEEFSLSMEASLGTERQASWHFHCVISSAPNTYGPKGISVFPEQWKWLERKPHIQRCVMNMSRGQRKLVTRSHAYLQIKKVGKLACVTNLRKGHDFVCEVGWVLQWWQLRKITTADAEMEVVENRHGVESGLKQLRCWQNEIHNVTVSRELAQIRDLFSEGLKKFKTFDAVENFKAQFSTSNWGVMKRFKFLVLVGPSRMGKTCLAMSIFPNKTFYTNCQGAVQPNLSGFERTRFDGIVCDEIEPQLVVQNKALFQSGPLGVKLQESRTNLFSQSHNLYFKGIICVSNTWERGKLTHDEWEWILANSFTLEVNEECWIQA